MNLTMTLKNFFQTILVMEENEYTMEDYTEESSVGVVKGKNYLNEEEFAQLICRIHMNDSDFTVEALEMFLNYIDTVAEERGLNALSTITTLKALALVFNGWDIMRPDRTVARAAKLIFEVSKKNNELTYINLVVTEIMGHIYRFLDICPHVFRCHVSEAEWDVVERITFGSFWTYCVMIATKFFYNDSNCSVPYLCVLIFRKIRDVFDMILSTEVIENGWELDMHALVAILYMKTVLHYPVFSLEYCSDLRSLLCWLKVPRQLNEYFSTKACDLGLFNILEILFKNQPDILLNAGILHSLIYYLHINHDYVYHFNMAYSDEHILYPILEIILHSVLNISHCNCSIVQLVNCNAAVVLCEYLSLPRRLRSIVLLTIISIELTFRKSNNEEISIVDYQNAMDGLVRVSPVDSEFKMKRYINNNNISQMLNRENGMSTYIEGSCGQGDYYEQNIVQKLQTSHYQQALCELGESIGSNNSQTAQSFLEQNEAKVMQNYFEPNNSIVIGETFEQNDTKVVQSYFDQNNSNVKGDSFEQNRTKVAHSYFEQNNSTVTGDSFDQTDVKVVQNYFGQNSSKIANFSFEPNGTEVMQSYFAPNNNKVAEDSLRQDDSEVVPSFFEQESPITIDNANEIQSHYSSGESSVSAVPSPYTSIPADSEDDIDKYGINKQ